MFMKYKKKAFAFIQSLIVFMLVILIVSISVTLISSNYLKANTFKSYPDKKSLAIEEELILKIINKDKNYTYSDNKYELIKRKEVYYLVKKSTNSNTYFQLELKEKEGEKFLVPTYYKTKNIIGDINID